MQQIKKALNQEALTDEQIDEEMGKQVAARSVRSMAKENKKLTTILALLEEAIAFDGIDRWMSVESIVYCLTDEVELRKFMRALLPQSMIHDHRHAVKRIVNYLLHLRNRGLIFWNDLIGDAISTLNDRLIENMQLLGSIP